ncbi:MULTISPECIES: hypothetical protein [unclassified Streptomyces]|uniref:hypothetical protein n=1 Tax=unclassified Streptomyces TaxID=2593676 RepID=UPI00386A9D50|nr:hypothetical protein OG331_02195 [Streptomyces sp. NBC_01017]WSV35065.1 hypothetical protein OG331_49780 [Streptomyces sp. NBC_01017]
MSWTDMVERVIADEYVQIAQCFPASDRGLAAFRALWLASVAEELAPAADPSGTAPVPRPFDMLLRAFVADTGGQQASCAADEPARLHGAIKDFVDRVGAL